MKLKTAAVAAFIGVMASATLAAADEEPKYGGTLTYMIPADAPPSFDAHREETYATIHSTAPFYSDLIRADPYDPGKTDDLVCDLCTAMPKSTDERQDLDLQDPRGGQIHRRLAIDRRGYRRELERDHLPAARRHQRATEQFRHGRQGRGRRSDHRGLPPQIRHRRVLAGIGRSLCLDLQEGDPRQGSALVRKEHLGSGPFKFVSYEIGQSIKGERNPDYFHKGMPYLDGFTGDICRRSRRSGIEAIRSDRAAIEFRGFPPAAVDELKKALGDKTGDTDERLELRRRGDPEPQAQAVRRRARAPRPDPGDRPLGQRARAVQDRARAHGRRRHLPRLAAGPEQGGIAADRRLLARHREIARRGAAPAAKRPGPRGSASNCSTATTISPINIMGSGSSTSGARSACT